MAERRMAKSVVINTTAGTVTIDGEQLPWFVAKDGMEITEINDTGTCVVHIPVLAETAAVTR